MARIWKTQVLGVGLLTPALTGYPHAAVAHSVDTAAENKKIESIGIASHEAAIQLLKDGIFALSPTEKLKIGGDRIRLSANATKGAGSNRSQVATSLCKPVNAPKRTKAFPPTESDVRMKRDIVRLARLKNGLALYRFRYIWSAKFYVGVMAQEVLAVEPDAVMRGPDGYLSVNYERLGLRMQTWEEWLVSSGRIEQAA